MLFSRDSVADLINRSFEPVWESVRPVPLVHIDFGNGKVLTRTLHGNVLTSICTGDGMVVDALPGIYEEKEYLSALQKIQSVAQALAPLSEAERDRRVQQYHQQQVRLLTQAARLEQLRADLLTLPISKGMIERPLELAVAPPVPAELASSRAAARAAGKPPQNGEDVSRWQALLNDTRLNERTRRQQIHTLLARAQRPRPAEVLHPIYRDVLHADLDDPYLGLGTALFETYPFSREDQGL